MVRVLLAAGGDAFELADEDGRTAFESQTLTIREFLLNETLFCGRFEVPSFRPESPAKPEHATATSVVLRARDKFPGVDEDGRRHPRDVVLKLMKHKAQFDNETGQRQGLHVAFVIKVIYTSTDEGLASKWIKELPPEYADYPFGIVMPAAERNLMDVLLKERVDLALGKTMFASFARALGHLHDRGLIQGDFKPGNVVRMPDGTWILIDMDGAVRIGDPIGAKGLSTAFMPPEACHVQGDEVVFRVRREGAPYKVLEAHPTLDLWSFFVVLYRVVVHRPLLEADDRDNLRSKREEMTLATWGPRALSDALLDAMAASIADGVSAIEQLLVMDTFAWGLQADPAARPQSMDELLAHPFFSTSAAPQASSDISSLRASPVLHTAAALGDLSAVELRIAQGDPAEAEPLLGRSALHFAAAAGRLEVVQLLIGQSTVDASALDAAGRSPLEYAQALHERLKGNAKWEARLNAVIDVLMEADLLKQIERQATEGVTCAEGQRVRNYFQSQIRRSVNEYRANVIISYATGTRMQWSGHPTDLDGEGCGLGMMYTYLVVRYLARAGILCFTGLHVEGGYNWHVYFEKLRLAKVMIVIMSPAFFKSVPCFKEQLEARKNGLHVIPLLFQLEENGNPPGAVEGGGAKWIEAYEEMIGGEDEQAGHDTLCAFRLRDDHDKGLKLNSEPAPPNTMLDGNQLLEKLVGRVKRVLDEKGAAGASLSDEAVLQARIAELEAAVRERDTTIANLKLAHADQAGEGR